MALAPNFAKELAVREDFSGVANQASQKVVSDAPRSPEKEPKTEIVFARSLSVIFPPSAIISPRKNGNFP
jgi:hypothetical protein